MTFISYIVEVDQGIRLKFGQDRRNAGRPFLQATKKTLTPEQIAANYVAIKSGVEGILQAHGGSIASEVENTRLVVETTYEAMEAIRKLPGVGSVNPNGRVRPTTQPQADKV